MYASNAIRWILLKNVMAAICLLVTETFLDALCIVHMFEVFCLYHILYNIYLVSIANVSHGLNSCWLSRILGKWNCFATAAVAVCLFNCLLDEIPNEKICKKKLKHEFDVNINNKKRNNQITTQAYNKYSNNNPVFASVARILLIIYAINIKCVWNVYQLFISCRYIQLSNKFAQPTLSPLHTSYQFNQWINGKRRESEGNTFEIFIKKRI